MTHDNEETEQFVELADITMTPDEHREVWESISNEMKKAKTYRSNARNWSNKITTGAAAMAAVAVVSIGIGYGLHHQTPTQGTTGRTTAVNVPNSNRTNTNPAHIRVTSTGDIEQTVNGGASWKVVTPSGYKATGIVSFRNTNGTQVAWIVAQNQSTNHAVILMTPNGGFSFHNRNVPPGISARDIQSLHFTSANDGTMTVSQNGSNLVYITQNGGLSWENNQPQQSTLSLSDMRIGKVSIGDSQSQVTKSYGNPTKKTLEHGIGIPEWIYSSQGFTVDFSSPDKQVVTIVVRSSFSGSTPRGIHIGSSENQVKKAYPNFTINSQSGNPSVTVVTTSADGKYSIEFAVSKGVVDSITLYKFN